MTYTFKIQVEQWQGDEIVDAPILSVEVNAEDAANAAHKLQRALQLVLRQDPRLFYIHDR